MAPLVGLLSFLVHREGPRFRGQPDSPWVRLRRAVCLKGQSLNHPFIQDAFTSRGVFLPFHIGELQDSLGKKSKGALSCDSQGSWSNIDAPVCLLVLFLLLSE